MNGVNKRSKAVHPHGRGDGAAELAELEAVGGSPPRAWGRRMICAHDAARPRFTPTGVGTAQRGRF